ncbi:hypothetical protein [Sphingomonas sp. VNH70]|uniref:hypothetical protein n=1 Tax=Sphingomonas silueang TaxID=3156617 RepID=UPI0032B4F869
MSIVTAAFAACLLVLTRWRDLPMARALQPFLVAGPARFLNGLTAGHWLLMLLLSAAVATVLWMGGDMIVVSALMSPEILAYLALIDAATLIDAALAAVALTGTARGLSLRRWLPRPRTIRARRMRRVRHSAAANDDDPAWALSA